MPCSDVLPGTVVESYTVEDGDLLLVLRVVIFGITPFGDDMDTEEEGLVGYECIFSGEEF